LQRYGNGLIDNLTYTLNGYLLTKVEDATGNAAGFSNGASTSNEYTYDVNGNLTKDSNKGIASISYNSLNLPSVVTFSDGSTITYLYTADGRKLRTTHVINGTTTTTDYCGNVIYEGTTPKKLLTDEGYVDLTTATPTYYYYLKDHQGNNRVVINADGGDAVEVNHYYPFGSLFSTSTNVQPYKYNGKELDTKKGLNWYDYGARHYDATLGRFTTIDPLAEDMAIWSPYGYCYDNPMMFIDPDGKRGRPTQRPIRRGLRNGGRPNPYAFYPGGFRPYSRISTTSISYNGTGLKEKIALGKQKYIEDITVGSNTIQTNRGNENSIYIAGFIGLYENNKEYTDRLLEMSTTTFYQENGVVTKKRNIVILDKELAKAQAIYEKKYNEISKQLGDDLTLIEKGNIITDKIGFSPLNIIMMDMIINRDDYESTRKEKILPEFRQGY